MAYTALALVEAAPAGFIPSVFREHSGPGEVVGIHVKNACIRIDRRTAPFRTAIEARKQHSILAYGEREELALAAHFSKFCKRPLMCFRGSIREHILGQKLAREGSGFVGQRLVLCCNLSWNIAGRILVEFNGE